MVLFVLIFFLLLLAYAWIIGIYLKGWHRLPDFQPTSVSLSTTVSVVIPARNEEQNIERLLNSLAEQDLDPALFEIIIVDDHSTDRTWELANNFSAGKIRLKVLRLQDIIETTTEIAFKKRALLEGISIARGQLIVTSDADCIYKASWLRSIVQSYEQKNWKALAGPVITFKRHSVVGLFQTLDFLSLQGITGGALQQGLHTMANGANLSFEKNTFAEVGGYKGIDDIASGDDMLLVQKIMMAYPAQVHYIKSRSAIVETEPAPNWSSFFSQRIRWSSKAVHYKDKRLFRILQVVYFFNLCFPIFLVICILHPSWLFLLLLFLLAKIIIEYPLVNAVAGFFSRRAIMVYFPLFQPLHILYTIIAGFLGRFSTYKWKDREIKMK